jgi:N-acetylmuramoyl-L-alanine amidase
MKIENHILVSAKQDIIPGGSVMNLRRFLVIHSTCGASGESSIAMWKEKADGVCAHLVIDRDGSVVQCRAFNRTAGHAGRSLWHHDHENYANLNSCSIGIELANAGNDKGAIGWAKRQPGFRSIIARHQNGGPILEWECYPPAQLAACEMVSKLLCERYKLDDVVGHDQISPDRRDDPGPAFPMDRLRSSCGLS